VPVPLRRLLPDPAEGLTADALLAAVDLGALAPPGRPYVVANMVVSADGRAAVAGRSGPLGGDADKAMFFALRGSVDAVLAGAGTLRAEHYGRLVRRPERRAARVARGLAADPVALVLSRSGDVPDAPMLADPEQPRAIYTGADAEPASALRRVRAEHRVRSVLCEGGPSLLAALLAAGLVDELFLTVAPLLAGGADPLTVVGPGLERPAGLELVWALEAGGELLLRYAVAAAA
jgi:riboflavin biosynthesis pyrimidine reductase